MCAVHIDAIGVENNTSLREAALAYAELGCKIFPCHWPIFNGPDVACSCGNPHCGKNTGKHPRSQNGHKDATEDRDRIARYWSLYPLANIGLTTGEVNNLTVLDIDPRNGGDKSLAALEREHGALPPTPRNRSGSGGEHIFFLHVDGVHCSSNELAPGIDIKSDGGYVIMPPSLHFSGHRYALATTGSFAEAPHWLVKRLNPRRARRAAAPSSAWRELFAVGAVEGARDTAIIKMTGYLLRRGLDPLLVEDIVQMWNRVRFRPPLDEELVQRDVNSICRSELRKWSA